MAGLLPGDGEPARVPLISKPHFEVCVWVLFGISIVSFFIRIGIRKYCSHRLVIEDYLMTFTLFIYVAAATTYHIYLDDIFTVYQVLNGLEAPGPGIINATTSSLEADGIIVILTITGVWMIKLNYLFFFRRLTTQIRFYVILWRVVLGLILASGVCNLAIIPYNCTFATFAQMIQSCDTDDTISHSDKVNKAGVGLDIATDCMLIAFPIIILWPTKLRLSQKILLTGLFSFTLLTIGVTVVRGSSFGAQFYMSMDRVSVKVMDFVWILFWYWVEFSVAFTIANLVAFRSLFTSREQRHRDERYQRYLRAQPSGENTIGSCGKTLKHPAAASKRTVDNFDESLLETARDWEGTELDVEGEYVGLARITKTVDLTQRTSFIAVREPGPASRLSTMALAAYCYHEESSKLAHNTATVGDNQTGVPAVFTRPDGVHG